MNEKFDASVNPQHAGITPLALACALNKIQMTQVPNSSCHCCQRIYMKNKRFHKQLCYIFKFYCSQTLLDCGADVNVPFAALNTTALMTSSYHGHTDVVKILLEHNANVHAVDLQQSTALGYAFGGKFTRTRCEKRRTFQ